MLWLVLNENYWMELSERSLELIRNGLERDSLHKSCWVTFAERDFPNELSIDLTCLEMIRTALKWFAMLSHFLNAWDFLNETCWAEPSERVLLNGFRTAMARFDMRSSDLLMCWKASTLLKGTSWLGSWLIWLAQKWPASLWNGLKFTDSLWLRQTFWMRLAELNLQKRLKWTDFDLLWHTLQTVLCFCMIFDTQNWTCSTRLDKLGWLNGIWISLKCCPMVFVSVTCFERCWLNGTR